MKLARRVVALAMLMAACGPSIGPGDGPRSDDAGDIELRWGEEVTITGTVVRISVVRVSEDSRLRVEPADTLTN